MPERSNLDNCFGCSASNRDGLQMRFRTLPGGHVESHTVVRDSFCGVDGVVHGGIQATLLDEVMGVAAQLALPDGASTAPCVTAELALTFRQPVPSGRVVARARVVKRHGADLYVHAELIDDNGAELTTARSRWRQLRI